MILHKTEPRIGGIAFHEVIGHAKGPILVMRVPQTWSAPHMVTVRKGRDFYMRHAAGKQPMDWLEIRDAFLFSGTVVDRVRKWRDERLDAIEGDRTVIRMTENTIAVLHTVPMSAFSSTLPNDVTQSIARVLDTSPQWVPDRCGYLRYCLDGYVCSSSELDGAPERYPNYALYFRHGGVEQIVFSLDRPDSHAQTVLGQKRPLVYPWVEAEPRVVTALTAHLSVLRACDIQGPYVAMVSFCFARDLRILDAHGFQSGYPLKSDRVICPEVFVSDQDGDQPERTARAMRPAFDFLWNGFGIKRSPNYDDSGNWKPHQQ